MKHLLLVVNFIILLLLLALPLQAAEHISAIQLTEDGASKRYDHTAVLDEENNEMIVFGGYFYEHGSGVTRMNDLWKYSLTNRTWNEIQATGDIPPPVNGHIAIYDPIDHRMLVFGGGKDGGILNSVYELDLDTYAWTLLSTSGTSPSARWSHAGIYDSQEHSMVIFGGRDLGSSLNDLWVLDLTTLTWQEITASGPSARMGTRATYIPDENKMIVFGGSNNLSMPWPNTHFNDVWEFCFDTQTWTELHPTGDPPMERDLQSQYYDEVNNRLIIYGGIGDFTLALGDVWQLDLNTLTWKRLFPHLARGAHSSIYNSSTQKLVVFGGECWDPIYAYGDGYELFVWKTTAIGNGDVNCDGQINTSDVIYLANYLFKSGPAPCDR